MNVLFISNDPSLCLPESSARTRLKGYARTIGTLHVLTPAKENLEVTDENLTIHGVRGSAVTTYRSRLKRGRALVQDAEIEIVSAQDPFENGWLARAITRGTKAKLHLQLHTDFLSPWFVRTGSLSMSFKNRVRRMIADILLPQADGIRVVSERIKTSLATRYANRIQSVTVLPIAVSTTVPERAELPPHSFQTVLVTIGRLEAEKHIDDILRALSKTPSSVGLFVIGEGRLRASLVRRTRELHISDRVSFLGAQTNAWGLMQSADAYIQASVYEGYGMTLVEAALSGVSIITTDVGIVGEVLTPKKDVVAVSPGDIKGLTSAITGLTGPLTERETRRANARNSVQSHLSAYQNLASLITSDLSRLLAGSTRA
ncbi:MAG: glycosyltransferase [Patescibacteria group bacterium]